MNGQNKILGAFLVISLCMTAGVWIYQDSLLKDKKKMLEIMNEKYGALNDGFAQLSEEYDFLDEKHAELEGLIPELEEEAFTIGLNEGEDIGYEKGYEIGKDIGEQTGYEDGYSVGQEDGYSEGVDIGYDSGYESGYDSGYLTGAESYAAGDYEGTYWFVRDPTYSEMKKFLHEDWTDKMIYNGTYRCGEFSHTLRDNAFKLGYRSFGVYLLLEDGAHMIVAFNTTDRGMIFIEPQRDDFVKLKIGINYWNDALQTSQKFRTPGYSDIIVEWSVHW